MQICLKTKPRAREQQAGPTFPAAVSQFTNSTHIGKLHKQGKKIKKLKRKSSLSRRLRAGHPIPSLGQQPHRRIELHRISLSLAPKKSFDKRKYAYSNLRFISAQQPLS